MYEKENDALNLMVNVPEIDGNVNDIWDISFIYISVTTVQGL